MSTRLRVLTSAFSSSVSACGLLMRSGSETDLGSNGVLGLLAMWSARAFPMHAIYVVGVSDVAYDKEKRRLKGSPYTEP